MNLWWKKKNPHPFSLKYLTFDFKNEIFQHPLIRKWCTCNKLGVFVFDWNASLYVHRLLWSPPTWTGVTSLHSSQWHLPADQSTKHLVPEATGRWTYIRKKKNCIRLQWHSRPLPLPLSWEEGLWLCGRGSAVVSHSWHWSLDERVGMVTGCSDLPLQSPRGPRAAPSTDLIIYSTRFVFTGCSCGSLCLILWLLYVFFRLR